MLKKSLIFNNRKICFWVYLLKKLLSHSKASASLLKNLVGRSG